MTGNIAIAGHNSPGQRQSRLFQFSKIIQPQNNDTIVDSIKIGQTIRIIGMAPIGIEENIDIIFIIGPGLFEPILVFLVDNLKIEQPRIEIAASAAGAIKWAQTIKSSSKPTIASAL